MVEEEIEGVVKFHLDFQSAPAPHRKLLGPLNAWRTILHRLGLTAQVAGRYGGLAYGNLSTRVFGEEVLGLSPLFVVSGTQTGGLAVLTENHYCWVVDYSLHANWLQAVGPISPSSETLTHAAVYDADPALNCVVHVHCPEVWSCAQRLRIPIVEDRIPYGTPEMASAVAALVRHKTHSLIAMAGHPDGIVAYGESIEDTATTLICTFAQALQLMQQGEA